MSIALTIAGADKAGALAQILTFLMRHGHSVIGQKFSDSAAGEKLLVIRVDTRELDRAALSTELKSLNSAFELVEAVIESTVGSDRQSATGSASGDALIKEMAKQFP